MNRAEENDIDSDSSEVYDWPEQSVLGKQLAKFEESLLCPICSGFYSNPQLLKCGHTFCSICIRKHFDKAINRVSADQCPVCKEKSELFDMKRNIVLCDIVKSFCALRKDLLITMRSSISVVPNGGGSQRVDDMTKSRGTTDRTSSNGGSTKIIKRMPHYSFHSSGNSREKIKKVIEQITIDSRVKLRVDGTKDDLERRVRELIHLNNAQIDNTQNPLSFEQVIARVNEMERNREASLLKSSKLVHKIEKIKNGESLQDVENKFKMMAQQIRERKNRDLAAVCRTTMHNNDPPREEDDTADDDDAAATSSSSICDSQPDGPSMMDVKPRIMNQILSRSNQIDEDYSWGPWRIVMSTKLLRPFFFNTLTGIGQFKIPPELNIIVTDDEPTTESSDVHLDTPSLTTPDATAPTGMIHEDGTQKSTESTYVGASSLLSVSAIDAANVLCNLEDQDIAVDEGNDIISIQSESGIVVVPVKQDKWSCKYCTYSNDVTVYTCEVCRNVDDAQKKESTLLLVNSGSVSNRMTSCSDVRTTRGSSSSLKRSGYGTEDLYSSMVINSNKLHASNKKSKSLKKGQSSSGSKHKRVKI